jgi:hypothetical protein
MKIAICYSGLFRPFDGFLENHKAALPDADYYFSTWTSEREKTLGSKLKVIMFDPPEVDYNLYQGSFAREYGADHQNKPSERKRLYTATMQHLGHYLITNSISKDYDIVIRMRYDTVMGNHDWMSLVNRSYTNNIAIGIGNANGGDDANGSMAKNVPTLHGNSSKFMLDFMNIHKRNNIADAVAMNNNRTLWPTNAGWYQLLSMKYGGHENYRGGIQLKRYVKV